MDPGLRGNPRKYFQPLFERGEHFCKATLETQFHPSAHPPPHTHTQSKWAAIPVSVLEWRVNLKENWQVRAGWCRQVPLHESWLFNDNKAMIHDLLF